MGYFPNATDQEKYEEEYCYNCVHYVDCPVMLLHFIWNYEQVRNIEKESILCTFIPRDGVHNGRCKMFYGGHPIDSMNVKNAIFEVAEKIGTLP